MERKLELFRPLVRWGRTWRCPALQYPLPGQPRIAVLTAGVRQTKNIRTFPQGFGDPVVAFAPESLAGPPRVLLALARLKTAGFVDVPTLSGACVVLACPTHGLLTEDDRDLLWHAFRVPLFEQLVTNSNHVLAAECEAHQGLHIQNDSTFTADGVLSALGVQIESAACPCGQLGKRLFPARPLLLPRRSRMLAAVS